MIVTPLGTVADAETKDISFDICSPDMVLDFTLTPIAIANDARGKGYWKHQFDTHLKNKPGFQETSAQMTSYINIIVARYVPNYSLMSVFNSNATDFTYWSSVLSYGGSDARKKAQAHFAALLFNYAALKVSQLQAVTADGNDVSDVITEVSNILSNTASTASLFEKAKNISEMVNSQIKIPAGMVKDWNHLYKNGTVEQVTDYKLFANYPNPFNPSTTIKFSVPAAGQVSLKVFDILGNEVAELVNGQMNEGFHTVNFNASNLSSGVYVYHLTAGGLRFTNKMILNK